MSTFWICVLVISLLISFRITLCFVVLYMIIGCAPMTADTQYEREDTLILATEDYNRRVAACPTAMILHRDTSTRIRRKLSKGEMIVAKCALRR